MLYRKISKTLEKYYENKDSKILVISGARQIGKSFIIRETGKKHFKHFIEINLKDDFDDKKLFDGVSKTESFYLQLSSLYGNDLGDADDTLIFLDEIQAYPALLSLLKALKRDAKYRYIASGSLLGLTLKQTFIPMGSIEIVKMYPLDFEEFLLAENVGKDVIEYAKNCFEKKNKVEENIHKVLLTKFREYLISGGLPDSVNAFINHSNVLEARKNQSDTYEFYKMDASQYDEAHKLKIRRIYDYLPSYMENKVKRIIFKKIEGKEDMNYEKYEEEFDYLISSGCALPAKAVANPVHPLMDSMSKNLIKLYYNDVGILSGLLFGNNIKSLLNFDSEANLGSVYETAVAMELSAHGHNLFYFDSKKVGEVDFLINDYDLFSPVAIEVKSGKNQNNFRAIPKLLREPYNLKKGYILGNKNVFETEGSLITMPIYMVMFL